MALDEKQWFDLLQNRFTQTTQPRWQDEQNRPIDPRPRNHQLDLLWSYYVGDPPLPQIAPEYQEVFRDIMRKSRTNFAEMCVSAMIDRMELQAVATDLDKSPNGDDIAAEIMEESGFETQFKDTLVYQFTMGEGFGLVVPTPGTVPTLHGIDPRRCVGVADPAHPVWLKAALIKEWDIEEAKEFAHLFLPGKHWKLHQVGSEWQPVNDDQLPEHTKVPPELGGIPVVRFVNPLGLGEYEKHLDVLDRLIDTTLQRMVLQRYQAFRQTAAIGDEDIDDDYDEDESAEENAPVKQELDFNKALKAGPGEVWKLPSGWELWQGQQSDLGPMLQAERDCGKTFAAVTHTPLYLITPDDANGSAAGAGLLREGILSKVRDRRSRNTPPLKLLWRIAFAMHGETTRGKNIKFRWGPIEFKSLAEKASASTQAKDVLSRQRIMRDIWEMAPEDIEENIAELDAEAVQAAVNQALARPPQPAPGQPGQPQQQPQQQPVTPRDNPAVA